MKEPIGKVPASKAHKYFLQLNLYENMMGVKCEKFLVHLKPGEAEAILIEVPDMQRQIELMLTYPVDSLL